MAHADPHPTHHRRPPLHRPARALLVVVVCLALLAAGGFAVSRLGDDDTGPASAAACTDTPVALSVDPRIAGVVADATADLDPWVAADDCLRIAVSGRESATTAAEIARPVAKGLSAPLPDLWIPDSSLWVELARGSRVGANRLQPGARPVATSPVVIAMRRRWAEQLGWPKKQPRWSRLLAAPEGRSELATTDLDEDAAALLTLDALTTSSRLQSLADLSSRFSVPLLGENTPAELVVDGEVDAIATSEQDVISANKNAPDKDHLVAAYDPQLRGATLDFPLAVLRPENDERTELVDHAAEVLGSALRDPATQELLAAAGLRTRRGELADLYGDHQGVLPTKRPVIRVPPADDVRSLLDAWSSVGRRSRLLVVVDRSGSMAETLPGSRRTRAALAQSSLRRVIETSAPDSDIGLWSFTSGLPTGDWQVLVSTGPLDSHVRGGTRRSALLGAVTTLDPKIGGGTPLYDSVLAAFRSAQRSFSYGRLNAVIVVTDGRNDDKRGRSLPQLLDALKLQFDGVRPVRIIAIAYGRRADVSTLRRITEVTGGRTYRALTAHDVSRVFARVLADL